MKKQLAKYGKKATKFLFSPFAVGLAVTGAMTYVSFLYYDNRSLAMANKDDHSLTALISQIHQKTIDWRLTDRGQAKGSDRVAILAIDEKAVQQEGRFPWPRDKQAKMVERALEYGAKSVSFDIVYGEPDETSALPTLRKLKRGIASKPQVAGEIGPMIDSELQQVDGDQAFANMIKAHADRLILGSFFNDGEPVSPHQDFCLDALFERTSEYRYWKREQSPLQVVDKSLERFQFPTALKQGLQDYMLPVEINASNLWFDRHPEMTPKITEQLDDLGLALPPESYSGLAILWLNNDVENAKLLLQQSKPEMATDEGVARLFTYYGAAFSKKSAASLRDDIREKGSGYCGHFLGPKDELLTWENYKRAWGDGEDVKAQFAEQSWEQIWKAARNAPAADGERAPANAKQETLEQMIHRVTTESLSNGVINIGSWVINIPQIAEHTKHTGYFNAKQDSDGTVRRSFLLVRRGNSYMPSLAFKQFLVDHNYHAVATIDAESRDRGNATRKVVKKLEIFDDKNNPVMQVPVDEYGFLMINYAGASQLFPHISAADVLNDSPKMEVEYRDLNPRNNRWQITKKLVDKKEFLKDKLLIAGATAVGIYDLRVTPFEENYPGVETHANVLSNLTIEQARATGGRAPASAPGFLRVHPAEPSTMWLSLIALGVAMAALLSYFGSVAGLGITGATLGGIYFVDKHVFFNAGIVTTVLFPIFEVCASYVTLTFYKYFTEERKKRELKGTFEKYVSPAIVNEVLSDPEKIELGGRKMELTVMFSDVRGFTTISEKLDPRQLSDLLNSYLTPMTDLVFKNKGTLDKYMGDAIMAFWGAPIHFEDHAKHACRCALQMIEKLKVLQEEYRAKGLPEIDIGIGLNTGDMSVGNMGSETVRSYTVMGDSVNLGSRLEGINKEYHTRIIISEFTQKEVKDSFVTREVDWVRVKGKAQPVRIFELIAESSVAPETGQMLKHFETGFQLYHERRFQEAIAAFNDALKIKPDDGVSQLYVERCEDYLKEPPGENWDGVCTMTHK